MRIESKDIDPATVRHFVYGLRPKISWMEKHGIDHRPFLIRAGISTSALSEPNVSISPTQEISFVQEMYETINIPELGLLIGPKYRATTYGILGLAVMTSETLKQAIEVMFDNIILTWTYMKFALYTDGEYAYLELQASRNLGTAHRFMLDRGLAASFTVFSDSLGQKLPVDRVELKHSTPSYEKKYQEIFSCPILFDADHDRYRFDKQCLSMIQSKAEPETSKIFSRQCQQIANTLQSKYDFAEHVRYYLVENIQSASNLEDVAKAFHSSPRTIQRKLAGENIQFRTLANEVKVNIAKEYLTSTKQSVDQIAARLGYNDSAAFSHAFKRWTGTPPSKYKNKRLY